MPAPSQLKDMGIGVGGTIERHQYIPTQSLDTGWGLVERNRGIHRILLKDNKALHFRKLSGLC